VSGLDKELAALRGVVRRLEREGNKDSASLLESVASKIEASLKPARRRTLAPDVEVLLEAEGFVSRPGAAIMVFHPRTIIHHRSILIRATLQPQTGKSSGTP
jgi:hypothetical protein